MPTSWPQCFTSAPKRDAQKPFPPAAHLLVVGTYYSSIAIAYVAYRAALPLDFHIMGNVAYAILTPILSPLIYTLRNKDVKAAIIKITCLKSQSGIGALDL